jgi:hypothetical protein
VLVKHVLQSIPINHMIVKTPQKLAAKLECNICSFLWGHNAEGGCKTALVAWSKLICSKEEGNLGL